MEIYNLNLINDIQEVEIYHYIYVFFFQLLLLDKYKYPCLSNFSSLTLLAMGKIVSGLLMALLMNGLTADYGHKDLTPNKRSWGFPVYPTWWFIKLIQDKSYESKKTLVIANHKIPLN